MSALTQGAPQVLGKPFDGGEWMREDSIQFLTGARPWPTNDTNRWGLFRNPLPPASEHACSETSVMMPGCRRGRWWGRDMMI